MAINSLPADPRSIDEGAGDAADVCGGVELGSVVFLAIVL